MESPNNTNITPEAQRPVGGEGLNKSVVVAIVVLLAILIIGFLVWPSGQSPMVGEGGELTETNLNDETVRKIPAGFPTSIPVEEQNIFESYKVDYAAENTTHYTVGFETELDRETLWQVYTNLFATMGYAQDASVTDMEAGVLQGFRNANTLTINITSEGEGSRVTIKFIEDHREIVDLSQ